MFSFETALMQCFYKRDINAKILHRNSADFNIVLMETIHDCSLKKKLHKIHCSRC